MPASAPIACAADTWVRVATAVTSAVIHKLNVLPGVYKQTYVNTAASAPTNDDNAVVAFGAADSFVFSDSTSSDIYIKAVGKTGSVRVDS
jgi:hypothetical protein